MTAPLLIEIGVEELPPTAMLDLADQFASGIVAELEKNGFQQANYQRFATPRRLAVLIDDVADAAPGYTETVQGPGVDVAFDANDQPTGAANGFARSLGVTLDKLVIEETSRGRRLTGQREIPGRSLNEHIGEVLTQTITALNIPKRMRWGMNTDSFVRPVHWLTVIHGSTCMPASLFGIASDHQTRGHRFHHPGPIPLDDATHYESSLRHTGYVLADPEKRAAIINEQVAHTAAECDARSISDDTLLAEINALVEYPTALTGRFDTQFLELPREVLIATMEHHQRYLPLEDSAGSLTNSFITIANVDSAQPELVASGNERVIRPRLDDALFFWNQDRTRGLASLVPKLAGVQFETKLGNLADKQQRVARIAAYLAPLFELSTGDTERAAELAKADLLTEMVDEFPDLQGVMGEYYALNDGETADIARAIRTQYAPVGGTGAIPDTALGRNLALADRLDTLAGIFAVDKRPSGDKDPYALRRAALSVVRILIESGSQLDLNAALDYAVSIQPVEAPSGTVDALRMFHVERLRSYFLEQGTAPQDIDAILAVSSHDPMDISNRLQAVSHFRTLPDAARVYEAHKRIRNILKKQGDTDNAPTRSHYQQAAEKQLGEMLDHRALNKDALIDYSDSLQSLTHFAAPLAAFFDEVRVIVDDANLRNNRLALLGALDREFCRVADISRLAS
ncbi:glycine--tRNA ligase subunit beta [Salinisphaera sp. USBA-960]|nr:glycine--tRNA ligase subunit beta [Salifodinibacter halophilus]NNC27072.1 glycine--tRNA ligase subunit beta [Salifodinibacter halophilus]